MSQHLKALVRRVEEELSRGNLDIVDDLFAPDFLSHTPSKEVHGREEEKRLIASLRNAFPDLRFSIDDQIAEGDKVVTRWTATGTHKGEFVDTPPTGQEVTISGVYIDRVVDGKIKESWVISDRLAFLEQVSNHLE
jgi:steroid delta-isomerase-like uncharacterized protein